MGGQKDGIQVYSSKLNLPSTLKCMPSKYFGSYSMTVKLGNRPTPEELQKLYKFLALDWKRFCDLIDCGCLQVADQSWEVAGNKALKLSHERKQPLRVIRRQMPAG